MLPVGQHPHAMPAVFFLRMFEVTVQLFDVIRVGVEARSRSDPPLDLYEGVEGGEVDRRPRAEGWRLLLDDLIALGEVREDEKVAYGAGYVGLSLVQIMSTEDFTGRIRVALVAWV